MFRLSGFLVFLLLASCNNNNENNYLKEPYLVVLGTMQDGGLPHAGCMKPCCGDAFDDPRKKISVVSLGLIDPENSKSYLVEAGPDIITQLHSLSMATGKSRNVLPDGIILTHAHIGHYAGLMYLGKEALNADQVSVYALPRMKEFLNNNGPWSQFVLLKNILLKDLEENIPIQLTDNISIVAFRIPHRDEFSETAGFVIKGPSGKVLFIPDIDKWGKWNRDIKAVIRSVDLAFIDGTFFDGKEIGHRDISEIPHPFVAESMELFKDLDENEKRKIRFIHFNHTNPLRDPESAEANNVRSRGFEIAVTGFTFGL